MQKEILKINFYLNLQNDKRCCLHELRTECNKKRENLEN